MADFYVGQIIQGGWNFAPSQTAMCNGQTLAISQNQALFALIGTYYGGNGTTTFNLPDLGGRVMVHQGRSSASGSTYVIGQIGGVEQETLTLANLPTHTHQVQSSLTPAISATTVKATTQIAASGSVLGHSVDIGDAGALPAIYAPAGSAATIPLGGVNMAGSITVGLTGQSLPISIVQPYTTITMAMVLFGIFPSRN